jgi:ligand-binding sensor domain-containing protein
VSDSVTAVAVSSNCNAYLVGTRNGFSFCPIGHGCQNYTSSSSTLPENYITAISQDCGGNIWLGMKDSGVVIFNPPTQAFIRVPMPDSLMQVTALAATADSCTGINYIGTAGGYVTLVDSSHHVLQVTTSVQTLTANPMDVKVYPQPAANQVNFLLGTSLASGMISFSDLEGRVLNSFNLKNTDKFPLDISGIADGLYLYTVSDDSQTLKTGKFEVLR